METKAIKFWKQGKKKEMCIFKSKPYLPSRYVDACAEDNSKVPCGFLSQSSSWVRIQNHLSISWAVKVTRGALCPRFSAGIVSEIIPHAALPCLLTD